MTVTWDLLGDWEDALSGWVSCSSSLSRNALLVWMLFSSWTRKLRISANNMDMASCCSSLLGLRGPSLPWLWPTNKVVKIAVNKVKVRWGMHTSQVAYQARAYPGFCSMKWLGVFLLSPGWDSGPSHGSIGEFDWSITKQKFWRHGNRSVARVRRPYFSAETSDCRKYVCARIYSLKCSNC